MPKVTNKRYPQNQYNSWPPIMLHQTVHAPDATNGYSTSARNTRCPLLSALGFQNGYLRHPTNHYPTSANSTWCHLWGALVLRAPDQYILFTTFLEWTIPLTQTFHLCRKWQINKLQYYSVANKHSQNDNVGKTTHQSRICSPSFTL